MDNTKEQLIDKIKGATNILVTVSSNPTVDQLAACLGLTLWLNKINKHATAVFSGDIPNALEFLQPEATIEKNTDSLQDFIIALDKSKADKLRYKVEDRVVKIFITPYRTSLSADDLEFSQGDFNVDAIIALGVTEQQDLDNAIISHGRILHDATIITINLTKDGGMGSLNWHDPSASSLTELVYELGHGLDINQLDPQIATALLTGIVAETNRFSNDKTSSQTMSTAAALMVAGANQQLVANKLDEAAEQLASVKADIAPTEQLTSDSTPKEETEPPQASVSDDGTLEIVHNEVEEKPAMPAPETAQPPEENEPINEDQPSESQDSSPGESTDEKTDTLDEGISNAERLVTEPPQLGGTFTANAQPEDTMEESLDQLSLPSVDHEPMLNRQPLYTPPEAKDEQPYIPPEQPAAGPAVADDLADKPREIEDNQTLSEIEQAVGSPHINSLRDQVQDALKSSPLPEPGPIEALNVSPVDLNLHQPTSPSPSEFNPENFELEAEDQEGPDGPPQVPPPIVPPDMLPPSPPAS